MKYKKTFFFGLGSIIIATPIITFLVLNVKIQNLDDNSDLGIVKKVLKQINPNQNTEHQDQKINFEINTNVKNDKLGIANPTDLMDTEISYKILGFNEVLGNVFVEVKVTKNQASLSKKITIKGFKQFKKLKQEQEEILKSLLQSKIWNNKFSENKNLSFKDISNLVVNKIVSTEKIGLDEIFSKDELKEVIVKYRLTNSDSEKKQITITISFYLKIRVDTINQIRDTQEQLIFTSDDIKVSGFKD